MSSELMKLIGICKCGVYLTVNRHKDMYQTAEAWIEELGDRECPEDLSDDVRAGVVANDSTVELQFYPDTPVGSYTVIHYDVDEAIAIALRIVRRDRGHA
jgi:hypothetical protein